MAERLQSKKRFVADARAALAAADAAVTATAPLPEDLATWLSRLRLLHGVPFQYLVPDEALLPPESIRFFTLDAAWIDTLTDGALSIGRTLSTDPGAMLSGLETGAGAHAAPRAHSLVTQQRAQHLGAEPAAAPSGVITGFLLRSALIAANPGLGVSAFPKGHTPADHDADPRARIVPLDILRFETLGPRSDVLICLVSGDAYRVDIHQPPEGLHYGIDQYEHKDGAVSAEKNLHLFSVENGAVKLKPEYTTVPIGDAFRPGAERVLEMAKLADKVAAANGRGAIDAAEMGFEMTQGVGMVSFVKGDCA